MTAAKRSAKRSKVDMLPPVTMEREAQKAAAKPLYEHRTDTGNARRMAALYAGKILFCATFRAWLIWNGRYWARDESLEIERLAKQTVEQMHREAREHPNEEER